MGKKRLPANTIRSPELVERCVQLRRGGLSYERIGKQIGVSGTTVQEWLNPDFTNRRREREKKRRKVESRGQVFNSHEAENDWRRQLASIPSVRTLNQAILGDPLPGRSALDRRQSQ